MTMKNTIKILQYQMMVPGPDADGVKTPQMIKTEALLKAERACMEAAEIGADMVCLPEMLRLSRMLCCASRNKGHRERRLWPKDSMKNGWRRPGRRK